MERIDKVGKYCNASVRSRAVDSLIIQRTWCKGRTVEYILDKLRCISRANEGEKRLDSRLNQMFDLLRVFYISSLRRVFESKSDRKHLPKSCRNSSPFFVWFKFWKSWKYCSESLFVVLLIAEQSCQFPDLQD